METKPEISTQIEDRLGVKCNFETECAWTWDKTSNDSFQVITGANLSESNLTGMMPGPVADAKGDANGKILLTFNTMHSKTSNFFFFFFFKQDISCIYD